MFLSLLRAQRAWVRCAGVMFALIAIVAMVAPRTADSATIPKIVSVDVEGNQHIASDRILAILEAKPGVQYDPRLVQDDLARLNTLGYFADVATPLVRARPGGVAITYRVVENPVITKILFTGNTAVPSDTLLALMDTSVGQVFNNNTFKQDVLKINSYYDSPAAGFEGLATHVKDLNIDPKSGVLTLAIQEGFTISDVEIVGDRILPPNLILPALAAKKGGVWSQQLGQKDYDAIKKIYDKYDLSIGNFVPGIDPTTIDNKNGTAAVKYEIDVARVAAVQITGNTKTKDQVIRRLLRLRPGMVIQQGLLKQDYDRLNSTGYFSKVDLNPKPGPDPKHPELVTLDWNVTEQKTASAQIGFGYSGGINGEGLYGTLGFQDNNLHGTGNGASLQFQKGARDNLAQLQMTIPYVGNTEKSQRYSFSGSIFSSGTTYYYPVYQVSQNGVSSTTAIPVTLYQPSSTSSPLGGVDATSIAKQAGLQFQVGRRMNDCYGFTLACTQVNVGATAERVTNDTTVPAPYFFQGGQTAIYNGGTTNNSLFGTSTGTSSFGITGGSIANVQTGQPYRLYYTTFGVSRTSLDDSFNPSQGGTASLTEILSDPSIGSSFRFTQTQLNFTRFLPFRKTNATIGVHALAETTTGAIPPNQLYTFSDQQVRGYQDIFYGTDAALGQIEFRQPVTPDRKLTAALFVDELSYRIRDANPLRDPYTNRIVGYPGKWSSVGDIGVGIRFDVPQLGLHTVRIDIAKGKNGTHTSFGIGQSF